ncbi:MAG: ATP-binding protein, partial [Lentisphaerae bacterium]|nr:ATP-binding protein [Lentisphaerota bacterium]
QSRRHLYLFVSKKSEPLLCSEYLEDIQRQFDVPVVGEIKTFRDIFRLLLELSKKEPFTLIVDEFQEFLQVNPAVYSEIQRLWDINKGKCRLNLICIGSVYSLMHRIFEEKKEPLFGRADRILALKPFAIRTIHKVLGDHGATGMKALFDCYVLTGGMPKYLDLLVANSALTFERMMDFVLQADSPLLNEGRNLLIEEFGKDYGTYFSILELISLGKTARMEMQSILEADIGGYLDRLENTFGIISRHKPINAKPNSRLQKYRITDNFLNFWFRFIYRNRSAIETGNFAYVREVIQRDYSGHCGLLLEKCFHELLAETGNYNRIGSYWERGNQNEIDLVALNDMKKTIAIADIKLNKSKLSGEKLKHRAQGLIASYPRHHPEWLGLSVENIADYLPKGM